MKLYTFGDSWTEGVGGDLIEEERASTLEEKTKIRNQYSWPTYLSKMLNIEHENYGVGGSGNKMIFESVCKCIDTKKINSGDIVIVMWSSSLRDNLPFFPYDDEWHIWGKRHIEKKYIYDPIINVETGKNILYNKLKKDYKEWFIIHLYDENYYNIVNQNYILYLQYMFKNLGIRYVFCDAFDNMVNNIVDKNIDKTYYIDKTHYWNFTKKTFRDFLNEMDRNDIWQDFKKPTNIIGTHPNKTGYKIISEEIYDFLERNEILKYKLEKNINPFL